jgi:hypothetical protein
MFFVQSVPRLYNELQCYICETVACLIPCGGGVEYLHYSPASRRRQQKGNPLPGGYKYGDLAIQVEGVSNLRQ